MSEVSNRQQYVVDVAELHRLHERNYAGLLHLLPDDDQPLQLKLGEWLSFSIKVISRARYTTDVELRQHEAHWAKSYLTAQLEVRLYHDVRMAEVIASQGVRRLAASYKQPNKAMRHRDEKHQVNQFLADWLRLCRGQGEIVPTTSNNFLPDDFK